MLDKLKLNNLIISNAKVIQKVRIQIVRKIIQRIRKLKMLIEKQPDHQSNIIKLRKCVTIVDQVKKIKREDVIRNILLLEKNPNKIVTNSQSKPEEVAIAMLAANTSMKDLIERFRQELNYNVEEAENWKKSLIEVGKLKAKKQRRKKRAEHMEKNPKKKVKGTLPKSNNKDLERINSGQDKKQKVKGSDITIDDSKSTKNLKDKTLKQTANDAKPSKKNSVRELKTTSDDDDEPSKNINFKVVEEKSEDSDQPVSPTEIKETLTEKFKAETQIKFLSGYAKFDVLPNKPKENAAKKSKGPVEVAVVDPFFITETGDPYVANFMLMPDTKEDANVTNKPQRDDFGLNPKKFRPGKMDTSKNAKLKSNNIKDERNHRERHSLVLKNKKQSPDANLHPSWAAKQKMKPIITAFQGKKITFGDEE